MQVYRFILQRTPQLLNEIYVQIAATAVHGTKHPGVLDTFDQVGRGKPRIPVGVNISGDPLRNATFSAVMQQPASTVFEKCQVTTYRLVRSMTATRQGEPIKTGIYLLSSHYT